MEEGRKAGRPKGSTNKRKNPFPGGRVPTKPLEQHSFEPHSDYNLERDKRPIAEVARFCVQNMPLNPKPYTTNH